MQLTVVLREQIELNVLEYFRVLKTHNVHTGDVVNEIPLHPKTLESRI